MVCLLGRVPTDLTRMSLTMYARAGQVNKQCLKAVSIHSLPSINCAVGVCSLLLLMLRVLVITASVVSINSDPVNWILQRRRSH